MRRAAWRVARAPAPPSLLPTAVPPFTARHANNTGCGAGTFVSVASTYMRKLVRPRNVSTRTFLTLLPLMLAGRDRLHRGERPWLLPQPAYLRRRHADHRHRRRHPDRHRRHRGHSEQRLWCRRVLQQRRVCALPRGILAGRNRHPKYPVPILPGWLLLSKRGHRRV